MVNICGFPEPHGCGWREGKSRMTGGQPLGLLLPLQLDCLCLNLFHILGFWMKLFSEKKSLLLGWGASLYSDHFLELSLDEFINGRREGLPWRKVKRGRKGILQEAPLPWLPQIPNKVIIQTWQQRDILNIFSPSPPHQVTCSYWFYHRDAPALGQGLVISFLDNYKYFPNGSL